MVLQPGQGRHPRRPARVRRRRHVPRRRPALATTAGLRTEILDFGGVDSSGILILRVEFLTSIGISPEILSQQILVGIILVGKLGVSLWVVLLVFERDRSCVDRATASLPKHQTSFSDFHVGRSHQTPRTLAIGGGCHRLPTRKVRVFTNMNPPSYSTRTCENWLQSTSPAAAPQGPSPSALPSCPCSRGGTTSCLWPTSRRRTRQRATRAGSRLGRVRLGSGGSHLSKRYWSNTWFLQSGESCRTFN